MHRVRLFLALLLGLAAIDSFIAVGFLEHPDVSPAALFARGVLCIIAGHLSTRRAADTAVLPAVSLLAALLSLAISDAVILASGVRIVPGFAGVGPAIARVAIPVAAVAAGAVATVVLGRVSRAWREVG